MNETFSSTKVNQKIYASRYKRVAEALNEKYGYKLTDKKILKIIHACSEVFREIMIDGNAVKIYGSIGMYPVKGRERFDRFLDFLAEKALEQL